MVMFRTCMPHLQPALVLQESQGQGVEGSGADVGHGLTQCGVVLEKLLHGGEGVMAEKRGCRMWPQ